MDKLEEQLKQALTRQDPPAGFADRVAAACPAERAAPIRFTGYRAFAAGLLLLFAGGAAYRRHEGEAAKQQVITALRITAGKLGRIQARVREVRP
jgi:hypothetical protein